MTSHRANQNIYFSFKASYSERQIASMLSISLTLKALDIKYVEINGKIFNLEKIRQGDRLRSLQ